jgi:ribosome biogenesis GTPase A
VKPLAETLTDTIMSEVELLLEDIRIPPTLLDTLQEVTNDIYSELTYVKNKQDTITTEQVTQDTTNLKQETATSTKTVQQDTKKKKPTSCLDALCGLFKKKTGN